MVMTGRWLAGVCSGLTEADTDGELWAQTGGREVPQKTSARAAQQRLRGECGMGKMLTGGETAGLAELAGWPDTECSSE
jgi:hypothetical protein